jgi:predicted enzyme related to lactoylglutathione lyase
MIRGIHGLLYSSDPDATRAFFRDAFRLPGSDVGGGWWIFDFPEGDLGIHPTEDAGEVGTHDISFYCDDIEGTMDELRSRGVEFTSGPEARGYGRVTHFTAPGGIKIQLYEPRYTKSRAGARSRRGAPAPKKTRAVASRRTKAKPARPRKRR